MTTRPTLFNDWALTDVIDPTSNQHNCVEPLAAWRTGEGWTYTEKPTRNYFNWWMRQTSYWTRYLDERRAANFVRMVAASDANADTLGAADYVCDGTNDEVQIQAAIDAAFAAGGGVVVLSEGHFYVLAAIAMKAAVELRGSGWGSVVKVADAVAASFSVIDCAAGTNCRVRFLQVDGNKAGIGAAYGHVGIDLGAGTRAMAEDCIVTGVAFNPALTGIGIRANASEQAIVGCVVTGCEKYGIYLDTSCGYSHVERCVVDSCLVDGVYEAGGAYNTLDRVLSSTNGANGFAIAGTKCKVCNCHATANSEDGFHVTGGRFRLVGCLSEANHYHGVEVNGASEGLIEGCEIVGNSQETDDTYHGIYLYGAGGGLLTITGNVVRHGGGAKQHHAGLSIADAPNGMPDCLIYANDFRSAGKTHAIDDPVPVGKSMPVYVWDDGGAAHVTDNLVALEHCNRIA